MITKKEILNWVLIRYFKGELEFKISPRNNENTEYWFYCKDVSIFNDFAPFVKSIHIRTVAGEKYYIVFRWGILKPMFDDLYNMKNKIQKKDIEELKKQISKETLN